jgi:LytS/YehU family sensor histidine kinase
MNTLNNIHSLIDIDTEEAKESIIHLSKLMRHLLYDSEGEKIPIQKEIEFIKNYVDLMKLRYSEKVKINLELPEQIPDKTIPPLLFTSFVENAFKHGISYQDSSFIEIAFLCTKDQLIFKVKNSAPHNTKVNENSGIGIENSRKRLDLIYGSKYDLKIEDRAEDYSVQLSIRI